MAEGPYGVHHDQSKNLLTYHALLQRLIDHDYDVEFRQSEIATLKFPLKLAEVTQVDSKASPAVQLADVMIGAAIEAANTLTGLRSGGPDPEAVLSLYADHQFIHMIPSIDREHNLRNLSTISPPTSLRLAIEAITMRPATDAKHSLFGPPCLFR
jgi:hypothetical protein